MYKAINGWTKESMLAHIEKEFKGKSVKETGMCMYRGPNGTKCAVGMFIPDELYKPEMDFAGNNSAFAILNGNVELRNLMPLEKEAMCVLQGRHDRNHRNEIYDDDRRSNDQVKNDILSWVEENVENS